MKARWFGGTHVRWMPIPLTVQAWLVWVSYFASLAWALTRSPVQPWLVVSLTLLLITVIVGTTGPETWHEDNEADTVDTVARAAIEKKLL